MKQRPTPKADQDVPKFTRGQLGIGIRGKDAARYAKATNIVVSDPAMPRAFPSTAAVNVALRAALTVAALATRPTPRPRQPARIRAAV